MSVSHFKMIFIVCCLSLTACSNVLFSSEGDSSATSGDVAPIVDGDNNTPEIPVQTKAQVRYPFQFEVADYPFLGTASKVYVQMQNGSCSLMNEMSSDLCGIDEVFSEFCHIEKVQDLAKDQDFTCQRLSIAQAIFNSAGQCAARTSSLTDSEKLQIADSSVYEIHSPAPTSGDISGIENVIQIPEITEITLGADCKCAYKGAFNSLWPALQSHCKAHFSEYSSQ